MLHHKSKKFHSKSLAVQKILVLKQDGTEDEYITISSLVALKEALSKINKLSAFSESATKLLDMLGMQSEIKTDIIDSWIKGQDDSTRYNISDLQVAIESELNKIKEQDQIQKKQGKIEIDINIDISEKSTSNYIGLFGDKKLEVASGHFRIS